MGQEQGVRIPLEDSRFAARHVLSTSAEGTPAHVDRCPPDSGGVAHELNAARRVE